MTPAFFQTFARDNVWMNGNIYRACETIPDDVRKKDQGAFPASPTCRRCKAAA